MSGAPDGTSHEQWEETDVGGESNDIACGELVMKDRSVVDGSAEGARAFVLEGGTAVAAGVERSGMVPIAMEDSHGNDNPEDEKGNGRQDVAQ